MITLSTYHPFFMWASSLLWMVGVLYLCYLVGKLLLHFSKARIIKESGFVEAFLSILLGWLYITTVYALSKSAGQSVLVLLFIPFGWFLFSMEKRSMPDWSFLKWKYAWCLFIVPLFLSLQFVQLVNGNHEFPYYIQNWDFSYYSNFIEALQNSGIENTHGQAVFFDQHAKGTTPYHYSEFWTGALFSDLTGFRPVVSLRLCVYSLFQTIFFFGILAIGECYGKVGIKEFFLSLLLMLTGGMFFTLYEKIPLMGAVKYLSDNHLLANGNVKYGPLYVLMVAVFVLYKLQYQRAAYATWVTLPVFFVATLPAVVGGIVLFGFYQLVISRKKITSFFWVLPLMLYSGMAFFYMLTSSQDNSSVSSPSELLLIYAMEQPIQVGLSMLGKKLLVCFGLFPVKYLLSLLPWCLWLLWQYGWKDLKQEVNTHRQIFLMITCSGVAGLFAFWLWYINVDAQQLFTNLAYPLVNVIIIVMIIRMWAKQRITRAGYATLVLMLGYMVFSNTSNIRNEIRRYNTKYSDHYLSGVKKLTDQIPGKGGVFLAGKEYYDTANVFTFKPTQHIEGYYLPLMQVHTPFTLSVFEMPALSKEEERINQKRFVRSSYFYRYCQERKVIIQPDELEKAMLSFIKEHKLKYLIVGRGATVPRSIEEYCDTCLTDPLSNERFCILKDE